MSYGIEVYKANGSRCFSTATQQGIAYGAPVSLPYAAAWTDYTFSFPAFTGRTGLLLGGMSVPSDFYSSWSYPAGVPTLSVTRGPDGPQITKTLYVFFQ